MRKISPANVKADFANQLAEIKQFYQAGLAAFTTDAHKSTLTEQALLASAVAWEGFVSDMFVAYINRAPSRFIQHLKDSFDTHLNSSKTPKNVFAAFGKLTLPKHLTKDQVESLADSVGNNITFSTYDDLEEKAGTWLTAANARRFTHITAQHKAIVNSVISLRNHVAHRSKRSLNAMNDALAEQALFPTGIRRTGNKFHNVGAWLKATPPGRAVSRLETIHTELGAIGAAV